MTFETVDDIYGEGSGESEEFLAHMAEIHADRLDLADLVASELDDLEIRHLFNVLDEDDARWQLILKKWQFNLAMEMWWV